VYEYLRLYCVSKKIMSCCHVSIKHDMWLALIQRGGLGAQIIGPHLAKIVGHKWHVLLTQVGI
jgi:hypothetical protein